MKYNYRVYDWNKGINGLADFIMDIIDEPTHTTSNHIFKDSLKNEKDYYEITCLVAGLDKEDISISYKMEKDTRILEIEFLKDSAFSKKGKKEYEIPELADMKNISSVLKNGILTITIPKDKEKIAEGKVEIKIQ